MKVRELVKFLCVDNKIISTLTLTLTEIRISFYYYRTHK